MKKLLLMSFLVLLTSCGGKISNNSLQNKVFLYQNDKLQSKIVIKNDTFYQKYEYFDDFGDIKYNSTIFSAYHNIKIDEGKIIEQENLIAIYRFNANQYEIGIKNPQELDSYLWHK